MKNLKMCWENYARITYINMKQEKKMGLIIYKELQNYTRKEDQQNYLKAGTKIIKELAGEKQGAKKGQNIDYCSKEDTRQEGPWMKGWVVKPDYDYLHPEDHTEWMKELTKIVTGPFERRKIRVYVDPKGNAGKSAYARYLCIKHDAVLVGGNKRYEICNRRKSISWRTRSKDMYIRFTKR